MTEDFSLFLPLSPAALHILLSLAAEDRHGYGIMQEVARQSDGQYRLGPGTLYDNLQKLMEQAVIEESSRRSGGDDPRRRYYGLTAFGRRGLLASVTRLAGGLRPPQLRLSADNPRRT